MENSQTKQLFIKLDFIHSGINITVDAIALGKYLSMFCVYVHTHL